MRLTQLDRHYCRECGVETEITTATLLDSGQTPCCRLCGSELVAFCEDADEPVPGLVFPGAPASLLERGRH